MKVRLSPIPRQKNYVLNRLRGNKWQKQVLRASAAKWLDGLG
jgi:hypothetical protein